MVGLVEKPTFRVLLLTPKAKLVDCRAGMVVIPCADGERGIMRNHCPLLTGLNRGIMKVCDIPDKQNQYYVLEGGFARFSENNLMVLAYDVVTFEGLDSEKTKHLVSQAKEALERHEFVKDEIQGADITRNRLIVRMAEIASQASSHK